MCSQDLRIARRRLEREKLTMAIVKHGRVVFETKSHGVAGFIEAIEKVKSNLCDASVADKVVGKAIALLCVYAKVQSVYAEIISRAAKDVLAKNSVCLEHRTLVDRILAADKTKICPFEQLMEKTADPSDAYMILRAVCSAGKQDARRMRTHE